MATVSTITLTYNEEENIERALKALQWADERIIIDSFSKDATLSKAEALSTRIIQRQMSDFSSLRNLGIKEAKGEWIFMVDADEVIPPELAEEIRTVIEDEKFDGYYINRINHMYGIRLNYDQPDYILRLFRKGKATYRNPVHEEAYVDGETAKLKNSFIHYSMKNLSEHIRKMNSYTDLASDRTDGSNLALLLKPFYRLVQNLIFKKAYREGIVGIILSLNAFFYEFVNLFKVWEKRYIKRDWLDFYKRVDIDKEIAHQRPVHKKLIDSIVFSSAEKVLEVGSGAAALSIFLIKDKNINLITADKKLDILKKVVRDAKGLEVDIKAVCADGFRLPFKDNSFGLVFSQGLLEHFQDAEIKDLVNEKLRVSSESVLVSMPNNYYKHRDLGDERLLSKEEWEELLSGFDIIESRNYYYLRTKRNFLRRRPIMYMCRIRKS